MLIAGRWVRRVLRLPELVVGVAALPVSHNEILTAATLYIGAQFPSLDF
jgi:hypothetical protein